MSVSESKMSDPTRSTKGWVRAIEFGRTMVTTDRSAPSHARYVGRVGALAVALGIGSGIVAMPMAFADTVGSAGAEASAGPSSKTSTPVRRSGAGRHADTSAPRTSTKNDSSAVRGAASAVKAPSPVNSDSMLPSPSVDVTAAQPAVHNDSAPAAVVAPAATAEVSAAPAPGIAAAR
ncbi:MAG TPA: hypothetical protein PLK19_19030, partial [Mycobacterium sp.]|nr:hypothetical protein [Mycobacterium sp.]